MKILVVLCLTLAIAYCGHYSVPLNATIHRFYFEDSNFDDYLELECNRDDRIQLWFNTKTKKTQAHDTQWYITNNTHKDIVYMEYQDTKDTNHKGMQGEEYDTMDQRALMDAIEHINLHKDFNDDFEMMRRHMQQNEIPRKPRKITLVQFHCYKVIDEEIEIIMSHVPPQNFHEMRRQLKEQRRNMEELSKEHQVEKFFTLYVTVNEKIFADDLSQEDL